MSEAAPDPESTRRLAVYSYLRPLVEGRKVLEVGCGTGEGAAHLLALGARTVVATDDDPAAVAEARARHAGITFLGAASPVALREAAPFDLVLVPNAVRLLRGGVIGSVRALLGPRGRLVCLVPSADRPNVDGLGYYDLLDTLSPHFPRVRMFGQTPFAAYGVAEFDDAAGGLRVDSGLVDEGSEQPISYLAVAGPDDPVALGYALIQVPQLGGGEAPAAGGELARQLAEAQGQIEGGLRVARAQTEEIEELRARLRRAAEDRARLDDEVARVRRALAEADESVVSLTRRTTEEMAALAQRLTAGLRPPEPARPAGEGVLLERLSAQQVALAARESALSERDERIAVLEAERQDLLWRLESAEEQLRHAAGQPQATVASDEELRARLAAREQSLEEFRRAATAHLDETLRLRDALSEQSAAVVELEESLASAQQRLEAAEQESARLRRLGAESEDADRQRRSRLAELEGTLLRLQRQAAAGPAHEAEPREENQRRLAELERQLFATRDRLSRAEADAASRAAALERGAAERDQLTHSEETLRARLADLAERNDGPRLEAALGEVERLRAALERSEEQLWEARGRLMADRERLEALERMLETGAAAPASADTQALIATVLSELAVLESGLRAEATQLAAIERMLGEWRTAVAADTASAGGQHQTGQSTEDVRPVRD
jgi:SAM-dependent methyltransferase